MVERYTSDVPAIPDENYVYINPERRGDIIDRALEEPDGTVPDGLLDIFAEMAEQKRNRVPIEYDYLIERFFDETNAQQYIDKYAVYDEDGRLNIDLTSSKLGIPYNFNISNAFIHGEITGLPGHGTIMSPEIHLNPEKPFHSVTFGHEIGHYFWRVIEEVPSAGYDRLEENFCNYFGRRMALPNEKLEEYGSIDEEVILEIMGRFKVELGDALTALMEAGILPPRVSVDSYNGEYRNLDYSEKVSRGTFCLHCEQVGGDYGCPNVNIPTPLFNLTDRAWAGKLRSCLGEDLHKPEIMSTLTKYYVSKEVQLVLFRPGAEY